MLSPEPVLTLRWGAVMETSFFGIAVLLAGVVGIFYVRRRFSRKRQDSAPV